MGSSLPCREPLKSLLFLGSSLEVYFVVFLSFENLLKYYRSIINFSKYWSFQKRSESQFLYIIIFIYFYSCRCAKIKKINAHIYKKKYFKKYQLSISLRTHPLQVRLGVRESEPNLGRNGRSCRERSS